MLKNLRKKAKNKKGFTLVELIVVIVIILILMAVLVPNMLRYVDKANKANCKADAATILSQLQADFAAAQATEQTGVDALGDSYTVSGVSVKKDATPGKNEAAYKVQEVTDATGSYSEITQFTYNNGKYKATWNMKSATAEGDTTKAGWTIEKITQ